MLYVFDVDKTLAESDCMMTEEFANTFRAWSKGKKYCFCSGSALPKMKEQITEDIINNATALFPVMGGELWLNGEMKYQRIFTPPAGFREDVEKAFAESPYPERTGDHIQDRVTMWCISVVGKAANMDQRYAYTAYDNETHERENIVKKLAPKYPELLFSIGGQISIDVSTVGNDKGQVLASLRKYIGDEPVTFCGDRMSEGGNDFPLAQKLKEESSSNILIPVTGPEDTILKLSSGI